MLDRLPDKILVKCLMKTQLDTRRNCRLVNKQANNLIQNFDLQREDIKHLEVRWYSGQCVVSMNGCEMGYKSATLDTFEELLTALPYLTNNIRNLSSLLLCNTEIHEELLSRLLEIPKISKLSINNCKLDSVDRWFNFLNATELDELSVVLSNIPLPSTILRNELTSVHCDSYGNAEMDWLTGEDIEDWIGPDKNIYLKGCRTWLTIDVILMLLKRMVHSNDERLQWWHFGILMSESSLTIKNALEDNSEMFTFGVEYQTIPNRTVSYWIRSKANRNIKAVVECLTAE